MKSLVFFVLFAVFPGAALAGREEMTVLLETLVNLRASAAKTPAAAISRIDFGSALKQGSQGRRVAQLHARLAELGYGAAALEDRFGEASEAAVRAYQAAAGIAVDGVVDEHTRFNLNLSDQDKVAILERQFEAMEKLFEEYKHERFIVVNLAGYTLRAYAEGDKKMESRVVVGRADRRTPVMKTPITGIVLNPSWTPPETILEKDIFPKGEINRKAVRRMGLKLIDESGQDVDMESVSSVADLQAGGYRLRQPPGERNALGQLKFDLANPHGIYMHDTNHRELFDRAYRAYSSGCIRVERYRELAAWVLNANQSDVDEELKNARTRRLKVDILPVHTVYWLAEVVNGKVVYQRDIYQQFKPGRKDSSLLR